jgi:HK97 family phage prohead protease
MPALRVRGYAAVFGNVDSYGEIIDTGAFSDWLDGNPNTSLPIFWEHDHIWSWSDPARPIGATTTIRQDKKGLYFEGELADTDKAAEIGVLLEQGAIRGASFAFRVVDQYQEDEVWHLSALTPKEISPVNWGANSEAYIEVIPQQESDDAATNEP